MKELVVYDMSSTFADEAEPCYKKEDVDPLLDKYEENIKELQAENRKLRYERMMFKAQYVRSQISRDAYYSWLISGYVKPMTHEEWVNRLCAIAEALEERARKIKEEM